MNLGFSEMLFIFLLAMIIFGPKRMPEIGRQIGSALNKFKSASNDFKAQLETEMRQIELEETLRKEKENISQILKSPLDTVAATGLGLDLGFNSASSSELPVSGTSAPPTAGWGAMGSSEIPGLGSGSSDSSAAASSTSVSEGQVTVTRGGWDEGSGVGPGVTRGPWDDEGEVGHSLPTDAAPMQPPAEVAAVALEGSPATPVTAAAIEKKDPLTPQMTIPPIPEKGTHA